MIKIVPNYVHTVDGGSKSLIYATHTYPPNQHPPTCPLRADCVALELRTNFGSRWYGVKRAWISSDLQMRVETLGTHFEEINAWEDAPIEKCAFWTESLSDPMCEKCPSCIEQLRLTWHLKTDDAHPFDDNYYIVLGTSIGDQWVLLRFWRMLKTWSVYNVKVERAEDPTGRL